MCKQRCQVGLLSVISFGFVDRRKLVPTLRYLTTFIFPHLITVGRLLNRRWSCSNVDVVSGHCFGVCTDFSCLRGFPCCPVEEDRVYFIETTLTDFRNYEFNNILGWALILFNGAEIQNMFIMKSKRD